jgi:hypothetical protein
MIFTSTATDFDGQLINHMTVAVRCEMTPGRRRHGPLGDTMFLGALQPSKADLHALARFGESRNYKIILPHFDAGDVGAGPLAYSVVVTDGMSDTVVFEGARLWKRSPDRASVLLIPAIGAEIGIDTRGLMKVREARDAYPDSGFALAQASVIARAASKPGKLPVMSQLGGMMVVNDFNRMVDGMKAAA